MTINELVLLLYSQQVEFAGIYYFQTQVKLYLFMTLKYVNRKNLVYYLAVNKTESGEEEYFFTRQKQFNSIEAIPDGYEVFEEPSGKIVLKKKHS